MKFCFTLRNARHRSKIEQLTIEHSKKENLHLELKIDKIIVLWQAAYCERSNACFLLRRTLSIHIRLKHENMSHLWLRSFEKCLIIKSFVARFRFVFLRWMKNVWRSIFTMNARTIMPISISISISPLLLLFDLHLFSWERCPKSAIESIKVTLFTLVYMSFVGTVSIDWLYIDILSQLFNFMSILFVLCFLQI
jgi:hypothetical protein